MGSIGFEIEWIGNGCIPNAASESEPTVTAATVASAFERIPLPNLTSIAQPADKTLVNFDTVFHAIAEPLTRSLTLLGQHVELKIAPNRFLWVFGDGETLTTQTPGAAYPVKDVLHRYQRTGSVQHHVEVTWTARWSLNGGAFQDVPGRVTTTGPQSGLRIVEATPNLSGG